MLKISENNGTEEISLVTPIPGSLHHQPVNTAMVITCGLPDSGSFMWKDFNYLRHICVENYRNYIHMFMFSQNNSAPYGLLTFINMKCICHKQQHGTSLKSFHNDFMFLMYVSLSRWLNTKNTILVNTSSFCSSVISLECIMLVIMLLQVLQSQWQQGLSVLGSTVHVT